MDIFGGGLGAHGEVCGAVVGGLAAIGLLCGRPSAGVPADLKMWKYSHLFLKLFREELSGGRLLCREIAAVDWTDSSQVKEYRESDRREFCRIMTGKTAKLAGELLEKAQAE